MYVVLFIDLILKTVLIFQNLSLMSEFTNVSIDQSSRVPIAILTHATHKRFLYYRLYLPQLWRMRI